MEFSIKRPISPLLNGTNFHPFFYPTFFSVAIESYLYETDFTPGPSQNYHSLVLSYSKHLKGQLGFPVSNEKSKLPVNWNPPWITKNQHFQSFGTPVSNKNEHFQSVWTPREWQKLITSSLLEPPWVTKNHHFQSVGTPLEWPMTDDGRRTAADRRRRTDDEWQMTYDKAGQVQSELSAGGTKWDVENSSQKVFKYIVVTYAPFFCC